jgi:hypothetical protein
MDLYKRYNGQIDEQFGFKASDSAPLVSASTIDSKIATSDMANHMMVWAEFGRPSFLARSQRQIVEGLATTCFRRRHLVCRWFRRILPVAPIGGRRQRDGCAEDSLSWTEAIARYSDKPLSDGGNGRHSLFRGQHDQNGDGTNIS